MKRNPDSFPQSAPLALRPVLVDLNCACLTLQLRGESVLELVDSGGLLWVWDLARKGSYRRELRFWLGELLTRSTHQPFPHLAPAEAIAKVVGHPYDLQLSTRTVADTLQSTRRMVHDWLDARELTGAPGRATDPRQYVLRASLVEFLTRRHLNG